MYHSHPMPPVSVENAFGGSSGHTFDLMALDSNAQVDRRGVPLPHFTLALARSRDVNLFAQGLSSVGVEVSNLYVFPAVLLVCSCHTGSIPVSSSFYHCASRMCSNVILVAYSFRDVFRVNLFVCLGSEKDPNSLGLSPFKLMACRVSRFFDSTFLVCLFSPCRKCQNYIVLRCQYLHDKGFPS